MSNVQALILWFLRSRPLGKLDLDVGVVSLGILGAPDNSILIAKNKLYLDFRDFVLVEEFHSFL